MDLVILDRKGPQCPYPTVTNYDMAAKPLPDLSHIPEFRFSDYTGHRPTFRGFFEWPDEGPEPPDHPFTHSMHVVRRPGGDELWLDNHVRQPEPGKADVTWDIHFQLKFSTPVDPDEELATPRGYMHALQKFEDPIIELNYFAETQCCTYHAQGGTDIEHQGRVLDIATDYQTLLANGLKAIDASMVDPSDGAPAQYCVRIKDEEMTDDDGNVYAVPRYANLNYIANMLRRIEWEKYMFACGRNERVRFEADADGDVAITYYGTEKDPEVIKQKKRRLLALWNEDHDALPDPLSLRPLPKRNEHHSTPLLARLTNDQLNQFLTSKTWGTEDDDPGRYAFHADIDPEPMRWQYPYGRCGWRCATVPWVDPIDETHNLCSIDGNDLYHDDHDRWTARQPAGDVGYAGPRDYIHTDEKHKNNHFLRDEEGDDETD